MSDEIQMIDVIASLRPKIFQRQSRVPKKLKEITQNLEAFPQTLSQLRHSLKKDLGDKYLVWMLSESGLMTFGGFFSDLSHRLWTKFLPVLDDPKDARTMVRKYFSKPADSDWLNFLSDEDIKSFLDLIMLGQSDLKNHFSSQLIQAIEVLSIRLAALGVDPMIHQQLSERPDLLEPFLNQCRLIEKLLVTPELLNSEMNKNIRKLIFPLLDQCEEAGLYLRELRHEIGASLNLTHSTIRIKEMVARLKTLVSISTDPEQSLNLFVPIFRRIVQGEIQKFHLREFLRGNLELVTYQITEHTGKTGEHYIAQDRSELKKLFLSSLLGGAIVSLLVVAKILITKASLPSGLEALFFSLNFAAGFLVIYFTGGTLATKQPAMTASTIAASLDNANKDLSELADLIIRTIKSQFVAVFGNLAAALPLCLIWGIFFNSVNFQLVDSEKATEILNSLHPLNSLSLWYAGLTGIYLFLSGIFAGFVNNWMTFHRIDKRIVQLSNSKKIIGKIGLGKIAMWVKTNLGSIASNILLGFLLGFMPFWFAAFGLPGDIRHITFSSGLFSIAMVNTFWQTPTELGIFAFFGIWLIGLTNLFVSFFLAIYLAIKSRKVNFKQSRKLLFLVMRRAFRSSQKSEHPPNPKGA